MEALSPGPPRRPSFPGPPGPPLSLWPPRSPGFPWPPWPPETPVPPGPPETPGPPLSLGPPRLHGFCEWCIVSGAAWWSKFPNSQQPPTNRSKVFRLTFVPIHPLFQILFFWWQQMRHLNFLMFLNREKGFFMKSLNLICMIPGIRMWYSEIRVPWTSFQICQRSVVRPLKYV